MWKTTNVYSHCESDNPIKFENGCWYEIGFQNMYQSIFTHQGIRIYKDGFFDDNGYYLKPFPSHAMKIELSIPDIK